MALLTLALEQGKVRFITACVRSWADGGRPLCVCVCVCGCSAQFEFSVAGRPRRLYRLLGRGAQAGHLDFHTALISELCPGFRVWMSY